MNELDDEVRNAKLDRILGEWISEKDPDPAELAARRHSILESCAGLPPGLQVALQITVERRGRSQGVLRVAEVAACVGVLLVGGWLWLRPPRAPNQSVNRVGSSPPDAQVAAISERERAALSRLLESYITVFPGQLGWVAESTAESEIGLTDLSPSEGLHPLGVRIAVARRRTGERTWNVVWSTDVLTTGSQPVRPPACAKPSQHGICERLPELWVFRLPDGLVYIESQVRLDDAVAEAVQSAALIELNQPTVVSNVTAAGHEYRLYHTVAALELRERLP